MRTGIEIEVSAADRARLEAIVADRNSPRKHVWRARILLATADGCGTAAVMRRAGVSKPSVWRWQERFMADGVDGLLHDKTRPARIAPLPKAVVETVVTRTLEDAAPDAMTHWTAPAMAAASGLSVSSVQRIWRAHGLRPHQVRSFKLSSDPKFAEKVEDIVGLYVDPPAHAVVLSIDEKLPWLPGPTLVVGPEREEIQALDRTQPGLPIKPGRCGTMTHDDKRHGTTTLFAALNLLDGSVIGRCRQRHRHQEFIRVLNAIERTVPAGKLIHVILDNYGAHKQAKVRRWLTRHPRWIFHFTPTSCSWLNAVETVFAKLTKRRLQRGVFPSLVAPQTAINRFVETDNQEPKPFVGKADPKAIIAAAQRGYQALDSIH